MSELFGVRAVTLAQDPLVVAVLGASATAVLFGWWVLRRAERESRDRARRLSIVATEASVAPQRAAKPGDNPALRRLASFVSAITPSAIAARTGDRLARAGRPYDLEVADFLALRFLSMTLLLVGAGALMWALRVDPMAVLLTALAGALLGYAVPGLLVDHASRVRQRAVVRAMPAALDMLALSTAAGLTLDGAMAQVVQRWDTPLSAELHRYLAEVRIGRDRRASLRAMARRMEIPEVTRLSAAIVQADALGLPIAQVLREQATEMRRIRRQRAEEAARSAPVKMVFPLVLFIFPALFVVVLGPAVPRILELFGSY